LKSAVPIPEQNTDIGSLRPNRKVLLAVAIKITRCDRTLQADVGSQMERSISVIQEDGPIVNRNIWLAIPIEVCGHNDAARILTVRISNGIGGSLGERDLALGAEGY
jgi:hypothetical protein